MVVGTDGNITNITNVIDHIADQGLADAQVRPTEEKLRFSPVGEVMAEIRRRSCGVVRLIASSAVWQTTHVKVRQAIAALLALRPQEEPLPENERLLTKVTVGSRGRCPSGRAAAEETALGRARLSCFSSFYLFCALFVVPARRPARRRASLVHRKSLWCRLWCRFCFTFIRFVPFYGVYVFSACPFLLVGGRLWCWLLLIFNLWGRPVCFNFLFRCEVYIVYLPGVGLYSV